MRFRAHPHAGDPGRGALLDGEGVHRAAPPHVNGAFPPHGRGRSRFQHDAAGAQGHQVLIAGPVRRMRTEPVELVVLPGSACQQVRVDIGGLGAQHGAHGREERAGLDGVLRSYCSAIFGREPSSVAVRGPQSVG